MPDELSQRHILPLQTAAITIAAADQSSMARTHAPSAPLIEIAFNSDNGLNRVLKPDPKIHTTFRVAGMMPLRRFSDQCGPKPTCLNLVCLLKVF
jgi:hypothetical protein